MPGPDSPPAADPVTVKAWLSRWPTGAQKVELLHGVFFFVGDFASMTWIRRGVPYPGRRPVLNADGDRASDRRAPHGEAPAGALCLVVGPRRATDMGRPDLGL